MANNEKIGEPETLQIDYPGLWPMIEPCRIEMTTSGAQDTIRSALRTGRFYEQEILEHVTRNAPRGGVYVDVGANIGTHAVWFGRWLADRIVCVEPCIHTRMPLVQNLVANRVRDFRIVTCALGAHAAAATRVLPGFVPEWDELVTVIPLDDMMANSCDRVNCIKIDTDGEDLHVLQGAAKTLTEHQPYLVVEVWSPNLQRLVPEFLAGFGYHVDPESQKWTSLTWCFSTRKPKTIGSSPHGPHRPNQL